MNWTQPEINLDFNGRSQAPRSGIIPVGIALILFHLLWRLVPNTTMYWLLLPLLAMLVWVASFGWRQALAALIALLLRLERL